MTTAKPQGESWEAVLSEHTFQSISIGIDGRVWAITSLGAPALRHRVTNANPDGSLKTLETLEVHLGNK